MPSFNERRHEDRSPEALAKGDFGPLLQVASHHISLRLPSISLSAYISARTHQYLKVAMFLTSKRLDYKLYLPSVLEHATEPQCLSPK